MPIDPRIPVLIGAGQVVRHWRGMADGKAPSPQDLRAEAARRALSDSGAGEAVAGSIDRIAVIRTMADSVPDAPQPFGRSANPPGALAAALGLKPRQVVYSHVGGDQPQALVNEAAEALFAGDIDCALIVGSEATAAAKIAMRAGLALDWTDARGSGDVFEDRGYGPRLTTPAELAVGLGAPVRTYPLFEHALRSRLGRSRGEHRAEMSALWADFAEVAAANPFAQFPTARSADFLSTASAENYPISDPYLKWDVAQDAVNQGAAVVLATTGLADRLGIPAKRRVYLTGYAEASDLAVSERNDLSRSPPMERALAQALAVAGLEARALDLIDLYSCFPCAVLLAAEALEIAQGSRPLTVTGGLPFFGGPGNSYSLHAIAEMVTRLRGRSGATGLVLANGGFLSKQAVGIYAADAPPAWRPIPRRDPGNALVELAEPVGAALVETYTIAWNKGAPSSAIVFARAADGRRIMAQSRQRACIETMIERDPIGRPVYFDMAEPVGWTLG